MDTGEVGDGTPDFLWHAGNENKLRYDVFLRHIGAVKIARGSLWVT